MTFVRVELIGHLGSEPLLRYALDGTAVAHLRVATDRYLSAAGRPGESRALWHRVEVWGPLAMVLQAHAHKGERVFLSGSLDYRRWTARDGTCHHFAVIKIAGPRSFLRLLGNSRPSDAARAWPDEGRSTQTQPIVVTTAVPSADATPTEAPG